MRWERALSRLLRGQLPTGSGFRVSHALIATCVVLFFMMISHGILAGVGARSILNPPIQLLQVWGGLVWIAVDHGQIWRCITYAFAHGGLIHLAFNMLVLFQVGPLIEHEVGAARFLTLYTFCALTGSLADYLWHPQVTVIGASSAIFGLIGFAALHYHRLGDVASLQRRNFMLQWAAFAFIFGLLVGADNAGHLGGLAGGALFGAVMPVRGMFRPALNRLFQVLGGVSLLMIVGSLLGMFWWIIFS